MFSTLKHMNSFLYGTLVSTTKRTGDTVIAQFERINGVYRYTRTPSSPSLKGGLTVYKTRNELLRKYKQLLAKEYWSKFAPTSEEEEVTPPEQEITPEVEDTPSEFTEVAPAY